MINTLPRSWLHCTGFLSASGLSSRLYWLILHKILHKLAPAYLSELLHVHTPVKAPRSSNQGLLDAPRDRLKNKGDRAFSVVAPNLWDSLPVHIRTAWGLEFLSHFLRHTCIPWLLFWVESRHCDIFTVFVLFVWELFQTLWSSELKLIN